MAKGIKTGGRKAGVVNKTTVDVREAIAAFAAANVGQMTTWLSSIDDPAKKLDLYLRAIEYHIPKLARSEVSGPDGGPQVVEATWRITE